MSSARKWRSRTPDSRMQSVLISLFCMWSQEQTNRRYQLGGRPHSICYISMGADQSSEFHTCKLKNPSDTALPAEIAPKTKLEASTQTEPMENDGYDMRTSRRTRKLFGVVSVAGKRGESSAVPRTDDPADSYYYCSSACKYAKHAVLAWCSCKWLEKM